MEILLQLASPILTAVVTIGGAWIAFSNRLAVLESKASELQPTKEGRTDQERLVAIETKVDMLTDEVRKHNGVLEKHYQLEARVTTLEQQR